MVPCSSASDIKVAESQGIAPKGFPYLIHCVGGCGGHLMANETLLRLRRCHKCRMAPCRLQGLLSEGGGGNVIQHQRLQILKAASPARELLRCTGTSLGHGTLPPLSGGLAGSS